MQFVTPIRYKEAVAKLGAKTVIGSTLSSAEWADVPAALRDAAFFSSRVESLRLLGRMQGGLGDWMTGARETLPNGKVALKVGSRADFVAQMSAFAEREGLGSVDPKDAGTVKDITSQKRQELIFDTQVKLATGYGDRKQAMDPDVLDEFPAQRFVRVQEVAEPRTWHTQFEDQVALKTDTGFWIAINQDFGLPHAPWGWGCGHDVEDVDRAESNALGLTKPGERITPVDVPAPDATARASTKGLAPELLDKLKTEFGDRLVIEGDTMRWRTNDDPPGPVAPPAPQPDPEPAPKPTPAPSPRPPGGEGQGEGVPVRKAPVSAAIKSELRGALRVQAEAALAAIDQVHDDGTLPPVPLRTTRGKYLGYLTSRGTAGNARATELALNPKGRWPQLTMIHEAGHLLDLEAIGAKGSFATTQAGSQLAPFLRVARDSAPIHALRRLLAQTDSYRQREYYAYLLEPVEIWARAYAQFVATRSRRPALLHQLELARSAEPHKQWADEDFAPLAAEIERLFKQLGWL